MAAGRAVEETEKIAGADKFRCGIFRAFSFAAASGKQSDPERAELQAARSR